MCLLSVCLWILGLKEYSFSSYYNEATAVDEPVMLIALFALRFVADVSNLLLGFLYEIADGADEVAVYFFL